MSKISINRRDLLKTAGLSAAGLAGVIAGPSLISHASTKPVASASTSGFKGYGNHCNDLPDNRGFAYFVEPGIGPPQSFMLSPHEYLMIVVSREVDSGATRGALNELLVM